MNHRHPHPRSHGNAMPAFVTFLLGTLLGAVAVMLGEGRVDLSGALGGRHAAHAGLVQELALDAMRLRGQATDASRGSFDAFEALREARQRGQRTLEVLKRGDAGRDIKPLADRYVLELDGLERSWQQLDYQLGRILAGETLVIELAEGAGLMAATMPQMQSRLDEAARGLIEAGADAQQVYLVSRQMLLIDRLQRSLAEILGGGAGAVTASDRLARERMFFRRVIEGLLEGQAELGIARVAPEAPRRMLAEALAIWVDVESNLQEIDQSAWELFEVQEAAAMVTLEGENLAERASLLASELLR